jgi:two-component system, NtrC family, nitrogen regulation response regulator GlnG
MKILILEDDAGSQTILQQVLEADGHHCVIFDSPKAALGAYSKENPDVVLTDIHLPGASDLQHVEAFCLAGDATVIVMTGYPTLNLCQQSMHFGAKGFLVKPFKVTEFLDLAGSAQLLRQERLDLLARVQELETELTLARAKK